MLAGFDGWIETVNLKRTPFLFLLAAMNCGRNGSLVLQYCSLKINNNPSWIIQPSPIVDGACFKHDSITQISVSSSGAHFLEIVPNARKLVSQVSFLEVR